MERVVCNGRRDAYPHELPAGTAAFGLCRARCSSRLYSCSTNFRRLDPVRATKSSKSSCSSNWSRAPCSGYARFARGAEVSAEVLVLDHGRNRPTWIRDEIVNRRRTSSFASSSKHNSRREGRSCSVATWRHGTGAVASVSISLCSWRCPHACSRRRRTGDRHRLQARCRGQVLAKSWLNFWRIAASPSNVVSRWWHLICFEALKRGSVDIPGILGHDRAGILKCRGPGFAPKMRELLSVSIKVESSTLRNSATPTRSP